MVSRIRGGIHQGLAQGVQADNIALLAQAIHPLQRLAIFEQPMSCMRACWSAPICIHRLISAGKAMCFKLLSWSGVTTALTF